MAEKLLEILLRSGSDSDFAHDGVDDVANDHTDGIQNQVVDICHLLEERKLRNLNVKRDERANSNDLLERIESLVDDGKPQLGPT